MSLVPMDTSEYDGDYDKDLSYYHIVSRRHLLDDSLIDPRLLSLPPQFNAADLQDLNPQGVDPNSTFAKALNKTNSALGDHLRTIIKGNIFSEGRDLRVTPDQVVTAALLTFQDRASTKTELIMRISTWAEFEPCCRYYSIDRLLNSENKIAFYRNSKPVELLRSVDALLDRAAQDFDTDFPPKTYIPPKDPAERSEWCRKMRAEITTQEGDSKGKKKRFHYKYEHDIDWLEGFRRERMLLMHEGRAPFRISDLCLPPLMENNIFSTFLEGGWTPDNERTFHRWTDLPSELRHKVYDHVYIYGEVIKVVAAIMPPKDESRDERIEYRLVAKVPRCLVPRQRSAGIAHDLGSSYWSLGLPEDVLRARLVNREFSSAIRDRFFKKNMFEVHDSIPTLHKHPRDCVRYSNTVACNWLKRMSELGLLNLITKLNIDLALREEGQTKTQFHQICTAAASMEKLQRLVVTLNMECFVDDDVSSDELNPEVDFHRPTVEAPLAWPGILPLVWAKNGVGPSPKLKISFPQSRKLERLVEHLMGMEDKDPNKVWAETEWDSQMEDWATADIAAGIAHATACRQSYQQRDGESLYENIYEMDFEDADDYRTDADDCTSDSNYWGNEDDKVAETTKNHGEDGDDAKG